MKKPDHRAEEKTEDFIHYLAKDASSSAQAPAASLSVRRFLGLWSAGAAVVVLLSILLLPEREDFRERLRQWNYSVLFLSWLLAALLPALRVYASAFPDARLKGWMRTLSRFALAPLGAILIWSVLAIRYGEFGYQVHREMNVFNGGCGMVILIAGSIHAAFLFSWLRRGAPANAAHAGAWAALSTGAFVSFIVQFACANEHPLHVLFWHFVPLCLFAFGASLTARKVLNWR